MALLRGNSLLVLVMIFFVISLIFFLSIGNTNNDGDSVAKSSGKKQPIAALSHASNSVDDAAGGRGGKEALKVQSLRLTVKALKKKNSELEKKLSEKTGVHVSHIQREDRALAPNHAKGQILESTEFGKALKKLAGQKDVKLFLEIGTFYGEGSTECIAKGMMLSDDPEKMLYSLEIYEPAWAYSRQQLLKYPVRCILGTSVGPAGFLKEDEIDMKDEHFAAYYERDVKLAAEMEALCGGDVRALGSITYPFVLQPMLEPLCQAHQFDAVLMDGNEYTGLAEYQTINSQCKPKYIAWKGVGSLKTREVEKLIEQDKNWKVYQEGQDSVGWVIYKHSKNSRH